MFKTISEHLRSNSGDTNVSKMIMVAIVFVVGAICLVMVTSAAKGPIGRWYETVVVDWFDKDGNNGGYSYDNGWAIIDGEGDGDTGDEGDIDDIIPGGNGGTSSGGGNAFVPSISYKPDIPILP